MFKKKNQEISPEQIQQQTREKTAQQWMPLADIRDCVVYRKDGQIFGAIRVYPKNLELFSDKEKKKKIEALTEALNGERGGMQIFCIGRPVDLTNYLEWLQEKANREMDFKRKLLLKNFISQASKMATSGEITEKRFYIFLTGKLGEEDELRNRLVELTHRLSLAELDTDLCIEDDYMDLFTLFASPITASYSKTDYRVDLPPLLQY